MTEETILTITAKDQASKVIGKVNSNIKTFNKSLKKSTGSVVRNASANLSKLSSVFDNLNDFTLGQVDAFGKLEANTRLAGFSLSRLSGIMGGVSGKFIVMGGAAAVAASAIAVLGVRGAKLQPQMVAFSNIIGGDATAALQALRKQTRGTVADFDLMRLSVQSLQGTSQDFRDVVAKDLGTIIDITNRVAQATGTSAEIVREKFLLGIRRQSAKLVDDVGVSVRGITDEIGFATEAIRQLKIVGAELGAPALTLENLKKPLVVFKNLLDQISVAFLPIIAPFADIIARISVAFGQFATIILSVVAPALSVVGAVIQAVIDLGFTLLNAVFGGSFRQAMQFVQAGAAIGKVAFEALGQAIVFVSGVIQSAVSSVIGTFGSVLPSLNLTAEQITFQAGFWGAKIIGSFAAGMADAATQVVEVVTFIARTIADFLEGFSPPKRGPLKNIDKGGENVAKAWVEGFAGGFLQSREEVEKAVGGFLKSVTGLSKEDVENQIKKLDLAIRPFVEQLDIAKALFEEIAGFIDPALSIIERQQKRLLEAFSRGEAGAEEVRTLDKQIERLARLKEEEQDRVDLAELQLTAAKSQQSVERALLGIQDNRLKNAEKLTDAIEDATQAATVVSAGGGAAGAVAGGGAGGAARIKKLPKAAVGGAGDVASTLTGASFGGGTPVDIFSNETITAAAESFKDGISEGFASSGVESAIAGLSGSTSELSSELGRIAAADPVAKITDKFDGLSEKISDVLDPVKTSVDSFKTGLSTAVEGIETVLVTVGEFFIATFGAEGIVQTAMASVTLFFETQWANIGLTFETVSISISTVIEGITSSLAVFKTQFFSIFVSIAAFVFTIFGFITNLFSTFATTGIGSALSSLVNTLNDKLISPIATAMMSVVSTIDDAIPDSLGLSANVNIPAIDVPGIGRIPGTGQSFSVNVNIDLPNTPVADELGGGGGSSASAASAANAARERRTQRAVEGRAKGGLGIKGTAIVGERGPELLRLARPTNIFPSGITQNILDVLANPSSIPLRSNSNGDNASSTTDNSKTVNATFNNVSNERSLLMMRQIEAFS